MTEIPIRGAWLNVDEIATWLVDNDIKFTVLHPSVGFNFCRVEFEHDEDALAFKLKWKIP